MKRQDKYPETTTFKYYNANPRGRISADCVVRAIGQAMSLPWEQVLREMTETGIKMSRVFNEKETEEKYLAEKGWVKHAQMRKDDNTKYTGKDFCKWLSKRYPHGELGMVVARIGGHHIVCIEPVKDLKAFHYKVVDTWDSTGGCVGNWWTEGE